MFAPEPEPEEIAEIAAKLRQAAGLPKEPTGVVANNGSSNGKTRLDQDQEEGQGQLTLSARGHNASMALVALKVLLAPVLVALATLVARRHGPALGGWVSALPVIAGPVLLVFVVEHGADFAQRAARGTLMGLVSLSAFIVAYAHVARRRSVALVARGRLARVLRRHPGDRRLGSLGSGRHDPRRRRSRPRVAAHAPRRAGASPGTGPVDASIARPRRC